MGGCLSDDAVLGFVAGELSEPDLAGAVQHIDGCGACRALVAHAAGASGGRPVQIGRYQILRVVGAGGMGTVYAARDPDLGRIVAVKLLHVDSVESVSALRERMAREAQAMARLAHPNVVTVHDIGAHGDQLFIAMELVEGTTLAGLLRDGHRRDWRARATLMCAAGRGLAAAHAAGIVHRDFKPENVLVGTDGRVRVTDFGLARVTAPDANPPPEVPGIPAPSMLTASGAIAGTPAYMPPEQMRGDAIDARTDQFSFAVAFYEALEGSRPYLPTARQGAALRPWTSRTPRWLRAIVERALALDRDRRWDSLDTMLDAIERALRWRRLVPVAIGGLAAIAAIVVATLYVGAPPARPPSALAWKPSLVATFTAADPLPMAASWNDGSILYVKDREYRIERPGAGGEVRGTLPDGLQDEHWALSPDARQPFVLGRGADGLELWQLGAGGPRLLDRPADDQVIGVSPDGGRLLLALRGAPVRVLDLETGHRRDLARGTNVESSAWSPDGERIALAVKGDDGRVEVEIVDARSGARVATLAAGERKIGDLAWIHPSTLVVASEQGARPTIEAWPLGPDGRRVAVEEVYAPPPPSRVVLMYPSRDALYLAMEVRHRQLHALDLTSRATARIETRIADDRVPVGWTAHGELVFSTGEGVEEATLALPPSGAPRTLATGGHPVAVLGDDVWVVRRTGPSRASLERLGPERAPIAIDSSSTEVACAGDRRPPCVVAISRGSHADLYLWTPGTTSLGPKVASMADWTTRSFGLSADGGTLAIARDTGVELVDLATARSTLVGRDPRASYYNAAWAEDGALYASLSWSRGQECRIVKITGDAVEVLHHEAGCAGWLYAIRVRPDQRALVFHRMAIAYELYRVPL